MSAPGLLRDRPLTQVAGHPRVFHMKQTTQRLDTRAARTMSRSQRNLGRVTDSRGRFVGWMIQDTRTGRKEIAK
jgi:hypothetical protein